MNQTKVLNELTKSIGDLLTLTSVTRTQHPGNPQCILTQAYSHLHTSVRLFLSHLDGFGFSEPLLAAMPDVKEDTARSVDRIEGVLRAINDSISSGHFTKFEERIAADVLSDLLEQAEVLLLEKFYLPAAVILRAVLEERLRKLCEKHNCLPISSRPTIESFKQALYSAGIIDKIVQNEIMWMASVGNAAAHALPEFRSEDVSTLYKNMLDFLVRFSP